MDTPGPKLAVVCFQSDKCKSRSAVSGIRSQTQFDLFRGALNISVNDNLAIQVHGQGWIGSIYAPNLALQKVQGCDVTVSGFLLVLER